MISLGPDDAATYHGLLRLSYESQFDACLAGKILNTPLWAPKYYWGRRSPNC